MSVAFAARAPMRAAFPTRHVPRPHTAPLDAQRCTNDHNDNPHLEYCRTFDTSSYFGYAQLPCQGPELVGRRLAHGQQVGHQLPHRGHAAGHLR